MLTHIELKGASHKLENKCEFITVNKVFLQVVLVAVFQGLGPHTWLLHWPLYLHRSSENVAAAAVSPSLQLVSVCRVLGRCACCCYQGSTQGCGSPVAVQVCVTGVCTGLTITVCG